MLLAVALDMSLMLDAKLIVLNWPLPPEYQVGGSR